LVPLTLHILVGQGVLPTSPRAQTMNLFAHPTAWKKHLKHRATEQLSKNKEEFGLKPEKVIHLFGYVCS
jgi:hypothetical protein